jgi:head-tail adaptor
MLTSTDLANLQTHQTASMLDTCVIQVYAMTLDDYGAEVDTYTDGSAIACGVNMTPASESRTAVMNVERVDATVRLPIATVIKSTDRVKVTHRYGVAITNIVFEVVGSIRRGPSGLQVALRVINP